MKTITEYRPMIFSRLAARGAKRLLSRRRFRADLLVGCGYSALGLWLGFDTGFVAWNWQFWLMFLPFFVAGEVAAVAWRSP